MNSNRSMPLPCFSITSWKNSSFSNASMSYKRGEKSRHILPSLRQILSTSYFTSFLRRILYTKWWRKWRHSNSITLIWPIHVFGIIGTVCTLKWPRLFTSIIIYMKKIRNDWLRAVQLIPNSAILCYHSANLCTFWKSHSCVFFSKLHSKSCYYLYIPFKWYLRLRVLLSDKLYGAWFN